MGALAYESRHAGPAQPRLFAVGGGVADRRSDAPAFTVDASLAAAALAASAAVARGGRFAPGQASRLRAVPAPAPVRTADAVLTGVFADLGSHRQTACVMCGGVVRPRPVAAGSVGAGRCSDCGTHFG